MSVSGGTLGDHLKKVSNSQASKLSEKKPIFEILNLGFHNRIVES